MQQASGWGEPPELLKLLAHEVRWRLLWLLARSDYRGKELAEQLGLPQNLVSYHLQLLLRSGVITERVSSADERARYYRAHLERLGKAYWQVARQLHPLLVSAGQPPVAAGSKDWQAALVEGKPLRVLVLCTRNSARSQIAEGWLRALSGGRVQATSAGSQPTEVHPLAVRACAALGLDISQQRTRSLAEVAEQPFFDYVITVCDRVRERCPTLPGQPCYLHWSTLDPVSTTGSEEEQLAVFLAVARELRQRVLAFLLMVLPEPARPALPQGSQH
ncbi:arsenate reductase/protein-tyrosine-phosphatase family protein [Thermogemmatispora onikobensis]|uniref:arsenate reductase/protein-tyrosine-phosphatase family protein n=1 Tax=Thermogemmatispora onikobensis TaxID=732234 RepID=UPI0008538D5E|nr:ArsR family transcriptional regulator [Thermogemmatispora onikobensis]